MSTRRKFLQQTSIAAAAAFLGQSAFASSLSRTSTLSPLEGAGIDKLGIQLFTLRDVLNKDVKAVIPKLATIGYNNVETYYGYPGAYTTKGFWGLDAKEFKALLRDNGMSSPSGHYNVTEFLTEGGNEEMLKNHIETAASVGQHYFVIPAVPTPVRQDGTAEDYKKLAVKFNRAAELCKTSGLKLAYHNHNFEFKPLGDTDGYTTLLKETDPALVSFELDLFWAINAGKDPLILFNENKGRFKMWHVKDMDKADKNVYTEVGSGSINFKPIFAQAKKAGLEHIFIEQDVIKIDPYDSVTQSIGYVKHQLL